MKDLTVINLFERHADANPEQIAIKQQHRSLSYSQLNQRANQLAQFLYSRGVMRGSIVNVMLPLESDLIAAMLGIFKAGGIYLPVNRSFSEKRFHNMLENAFHGVFLTVDQEEDYVLKHLNEAKIVQGALIVLGEKGALKIVDLSGKDVKNDHLDNYSDENADYGVDPEFENYIYYTSGSTGEAKPILGCHKSLYNYVSWVIEEFSIDVNHRVSHLAQSTFDASLKDTFMALAAGGTLCLPTQAVKDNIIKLLDWIQEEQISVMQTVPSVFRLMMRGMADSVVKYDFSALKHIMLDGEVLYEKDVMSWRSLAGEQTELVNLYGTTESTILDTFHRITNISGNPGQAIHVGQPIANTFILILNNNELCRIGEIGEVYIKTPYLTKGYYNNKELTDAAFVQNPLITDRADIVYRTGDLGRYLKDRNIEILGRKDKQVKVNGVRIELNEIERAVRELHGVQDVAVVVHTDQESRFSDMVCYFVAEGPMSIESIKQDLTKQLNAHIIPSYFVQLEEFPLNSNGKLDKKRLPIPQNLVIEPDFEPCEGELELALEAIWKDVLGRERIGRNAKFVMIGGQSLKAMQVVSRVYKELQVSITVRDVFEHQTIREMALHVASLSKGSYASIQNIEEQDIYAVSDAQKRLWILSQTREGNVAYNINALLSLEGDFDIDIFRKTIDTLVSRHESLRTAIVEHDGELYQKVNPESPFVLNFVDLSHDKEKQEKIDHYATMQVTSPFDIASGQLMKITLLKLEKGRHQFIFTMHHIISDAWSMRVLIKEMLTTYNAYKRESTPELAPLAIQYKDYMVWQKDQVLNSLEGRDRQYWHRQFSGELSRLPLPADFPRPPVKTYNGKRFKVAFSNDLYSKIQTFCRKEDLTLFTFLTTTLKALFYKYTSCKDQVMGTTIAGRDHHDLEGQIGFYVNTLALRTQFTDQETFSSLSKKVKNTVLGAYEHQVYPFERLVEELNIERDISHSPLFDILIELINIDFEMGATPEMDAVDIINQTLEHTVSKFDLTFSFKQVDQLILHIEFNSDLYTEETVRAMCDHLQQLTASAVESPEVELSELDYLSNQDIEAQLVSGSGADEEIQVYDLISRFEDVCHTHTDQVAIEINNATCTYGHLLTKVNQLTNYLINEYHIQPGDKVAVMSNHSVETVAGILAILKAGATFIPIDPVYPMERVEQLLDSVEPKAFLIDSYRLLEVSEIYGGQLFILDLQLDELEVPDKPLHIEYPSSTNAYIIFTSGSTGIPKGVPVTHKNLIHYLSWANSYYFNSDEPYTFGLFTSLSFDLSITALFTTLLRGDKLVLFPGKEVDEILLQVSGTESSVNTLKLTPSHLQLLAHLPVEKLNLKTIIVGGEALKAEHIKVLERLDFEGDLYNEYGPTEATVGCTVKHVKNTEEINSIGKPISGTSIFILDANLNMLPAGYPGEICICGPGVVSGYYNDEDLTRRKFVNLTIGDQTYIIYRTGDQGRRLRNGEIEYLGRLDEQIKLRGHRIEPVEIESKLAAHPHISAAKVVAVREQNGNDILVAYYTKNLNSEVPNFKNYLAKALPSYMIPACFIELKSFPLTVNGKIDTKRLPLPTPEVLQTNHEEARNPIEEQLIYIWEKVLNKKGIGINNNFFDLGGHSLKATQVAFDVRKRLNIDLQLKDIFSYPTVKDLAEFIVTSSPESYSGLTPIEEQEHYQLSHAQERMWILHQFEEQQAAYNIPGRYVFKGKLSIDALLQAFSSVIQRHESLRTSFFTLQGEPRQKVAPFVDIASFFEFKDFSQFENKGIEVSRLAKEETLRPFDLENAPLMRLILVKLQEEDYVLLYTVHHIISDGWSMDVLVREVFSAYNELQAPTGMELPALKIQYKDFASWQNTLLKTDTGDEAQSYWLEKFSVEIPVLNLPLDFPRPAMKTYNGSHVSARIGQELTTLLKEFARDNDVSVFILLAASLKAFLYKYTNQTEIIVGTPVAGRNHPDLEDQIGLYINTLALYTSFDAMQPFVSLLKQVGQNTLDAFDHQNYPFDKLLGELDLDRDMSRSPLFDVFLVVNHFERETSSLRGVEISGLDKDNPVSKFDLQFTFSVLENDIDLSISYNTDLFGRRKVALMAEHFITLLKSVVHHSMQPVSHLNMLTEKEREELLITFNDTLRPYDKNETVVHMIESQAALNPEAIALRYRDETFTYRQINEEANRLACYLIEKEGVSPGDFVGLITGRTQALIAGLLGILKAGAAYVTFDPEYPAERIGYILDDTDLSLVIVENREMGNVIGDRQKNTLILNELGAELQSFGKENPNVKIDPSDPAYILYTSGSTGRPKGVVIAHESVTTFLKWSAEEFAESPYDLAYATTSYCFDLSVYELFYPLTVGKTIRILENGLEISKYIHADTAVLVNTVPSVVKGLIDEAVNLENVSVMNMAGEPISNYIRTSLEGKVSEIRNLYGPSEDTTYSTCYRFAPDDKEISIGRPIANTRMYVLDDQLTPLPVGIPGELCISGAGLAKGYLNQSELTAEKFIPNPFIKGELLYKTGDFAQWNPDGQLSFLGRRDNQVKLRGYRIELGEIENAINKFPGVKESLVMVKGAPTGSKQLVAYITEKHSFSTTELHTFLLDRLPGYMVPVHLLKLANFPLTPNGKIDRSALPEPADNDVRHNEKARTESEQQLVEIWQNVLDVSPIGINDNFFSIGGDSIKALQIASRAHQQGFKIEVRNILKFPTISKLSALLKPVEQAEEKVVTGKFPLTPIQEVFFQERDCNINHYNQAVMFFNEQRFDQVALGNVINDLAAHHDMLRARFYVKDDVIQEIPDKEVNHVLAVFEQCSDEEQDAFIAEKTNWTQTNLDIEKGPVMRAVLLKCQDGDRLLIAVHHLVVDGVSWRVLLEDFKTLYQGYTEGKQPSLPLKGTSFKEWSVKLSEFANSDAFKKEAAYWALVADKAPGSLLSMDYPAGKNLIKEAKNEVFWLDEATTANLLKNTNQAYNTEITDILLTAIGSGLRTVCSQDKIPVDIEGHGREEIIGGMEISRTVGWFTTIYPTVFDFSYHHDLSRQIKEVKETLHQIPNKGIGYGLWKYLRKNGDINREASSGRGEVLFNYLGQFDTDLKKSNLTIAQESAGQVIDPERKREYVLEINGAVVEGKFQMSIIYPGLQFKPETIEKLKASIKSALEEVVQWCVSKEISEFTPSDLTYKDLSIEEVAEFCQRYPIQDIYPLSPMQEGLFFHILMDKNDTYFEQLSYSLEGELDVDLVQKSLNELFDRHEILRAGIFQDESGHPLQLIFRHRPIDFTFEDIHQLPESKKNAVVAKFKEDDKLRSFDLMRDTLLRVGILRTGKNRYECIWSHHHILLDGWCMSVLFTEYFEIYSSFSQNRPYVLPEVKPYRHYIEWLGKLDASASKQYWRGYLAQYDEVASIPSDINVKGVKGEYQQQELFFEVDSTRTEQVKAFAREHQITVNTFLQAIWGILLSKYSGKDDVVFGEVISGRPAEVDGIEKMVGLFINTVPVRISHSQDALFADLLTVVHENALERESHQYSPLVDIQSVTSLKKDLFDHILMLGNYPVFAPVDENDKNNLEQGMKVSDVNIFEQVNYNLNIGIGIGDKMLIKFNYNACVYSRLFLMNLFTHLENLMDQVLNREHIKVSELRLLSQASQAELLDQITSPSVIIKEASIHGAFEKQVEQNPDATAIVFKGKSLSYGELNSRANTLAYHLRELFSIVPDDRIGIMVNRSELMIVGILGILKSGAAYVPIDPEYPAERIGMILGDADVKVILTESDLMFAMGDVLRGELFALDIQLETLETKTENPETLTGPGHLAYIMYTSGSSGRPKGVAVEHKSVVRLVKNTNYTDLNTEHNVLQLSNFAFDGSVFDIFGSLLNGSCLHIVGKDVVLSNAKLIKYIADHDINVTFITTALFNNLVELSPESIASFDKIYFGGEEASISHISTALKYRKYEDSIVHVYGPTENTTFSTYYVLRELADQQISAPIGKAIANTTAYILDGELNPVPFGVTGEICLGGEGLARGYWRNEGLTNEKFVWHSFDGKHRERLYLTGDLGRFLEGGNIEFRGRKDNQVKIRGNRVELGEIENMMIRHDQVDQAHVVVKDIPGSEKYLVAYYKGTLEDIVAFRSFLEKFLPSAMVPAHFVKLEAFPYNANGKIDNRALPDPVRRSDKPEEYTAPATDVEKRLVAIWEDILKCSPISITDNFFLIGGDSIKAIRLVSAANREFNAEIEVKDVFLHPDLVSLAKRLAEDGASGDLGEARDQARQYLMNFKEDILAQESLVALLPAKWEDFFPASDIQKGMLYYSMSLSDHSVGMYHDQIFFQFEDATFDFAAFRNSFNMLVQKHPILRTSFDFENFSEEVQIVHSFNSEACDTSLVDISHLSSKQQKKFLQTFLKDDRREHFDITQPGLWRLRVFKLSDRDFGVLLVIHHAIIDGWSEASLRTELSNIYFSLKENITPGITELKATYRDFIIFQLAHRKSQDFASFWKAQLQGYQRSSLPLHKKISEHTSSQLESTQVAYQIPVEIGEKVLALSADLGIPVKTIFLTAYAYLIKLTTGKSDVTFGLVSNGRPDIEDGDKIIGCFLNTVPFRAKVNPDHTVKRLVKDVHDTETQLKQYDKLPLVEIAKTIGEETTGGNLIFDTLFNYLDLHIIQDMNQEAQGKKALVKSYVKTNTHFDFTVNRIDDIFHLHLIYASALYAEQDINRIFGYYQNILSALANHQQLSTANVLPQQEYDQLLSAFSSAPSDYPSDQSIASVFREVAASFPLHHAVVYGDKALTYQELDEQSDRFARFLISEQKVSKGDIIGVKLERSLLNIVSILGILKAGAAYAPFAADAEDERVDYMIRDLGLSAILVDQGDGKDYTCNKIYSGTIEALIETGGAGREVLCHEPQPSSLAYVMYTSGSTGEPKGVMVGHQSVVRLVRNTNYIELNTESRLLQNGSMAFDAVTFEVWGMLLNGGTLCLADDEDIQQMNRLKKTLDKYNINLVWFTAAWFHQIVDEDISVLSGLKTILVGGEKVARKHAQKFIDTLPHIAIYNMYGPTENTTFTTHYPIRELQPDMENVPIGRPISNSTVYVVDDHFELAPVGVVGEIVMGGDGLSYGYWKKPELTREKFVSDPFGGGKLYRSGDYGRWLPDGSLDYMGRIDNQVKVRGFRVEPGEIEAAMEKLEVVNKAAVVAVNASDGTKKLIAYYTGQSQEADIKLQLQRQLPAYMIPAFFVKREELPLNENGKIDREKLAISITEQKRKVYVAPANDIERELVNIWKEVLGMENISVEDDFFEIGGHSLTATRMLTKVHKALNVEVSLKKLFANPTLKMLAMEVSAATWALKSMVDEDENEYKDIII